MNGPCKPACQDVRADCVKVLLKHGANPNHQRNMGEIPMLLCAGGGHMVRSDSEALRCVQFLLAAVADPNHADHGGSTALVVAAKRGDEKLVATLLEAGAHQYREALVCAQLGGFARIINLLKAAETMSRVSPVTESESTAPPGAL